jgi:hypothetical protein
MGIILSDSGVEELHNTSVQQQYSDKNKKRLLSKSKEWISKMLFSDNNYHFTDGGFEHRIELTINLLMNFAGEKELVVEILENFFNTTENSFFDQMLDEDKINMLTHYKIINKELTSDWISKQVPHSIESIGIV